jgi:hypothetical protein
MSHASKRGLAGIAKIAENRRRRREWWRSEALALWKRWHADPLFVLGLGLYWGEGTKSMADQRLALTNSDVCLLRTWIRWCRTFMPGVPFDCSLVVHDTCDVEAAQAHWQRELGVSVRVVTVAVSSASKRTRNCLPYGTLKVRVARGSREWATKMLVWLELAKDL